MIQAAISIRVKGQIYKYVRDVTTDTFGVGTKYYGYRGNARRKINLTRNNITHSLGTGLVPKQNYNFRVAVNGGAIETFSVSFWPRDEQQPITYFDVINKLNSVSNNFRVEFIDAVREDEGIYFIAEGKIAGTQINVLSGLTNDLFAALNHFDAIGDEIASDNFFDQNAEAGQILHDLGTLTTQLQAVNIDAVPMLLFPESDGDIGMLIRESHEIKNHLVVNHVLRKSIDGFNIIEINKNVREGHVG